MNRFLHFLFPTRVSRLGYAMRLLATFWLLGLGFTEVEMTGLTRALESIQPDSPIQLPISKVQAFLLSGGIIYTFVYIFAPRIHDAGFRRWLAALMIIPFLNLFLLFLLAVLPTRLPVENSETPGSDDSEP